MSHTARYHTHTPTHLNTDVIRQLRYGMWTLPTVFFSYRALITISKKCNEVLMYLASFKTEPDELVFATRSDPARSTKFNFDLRILSDPATRTSKDMVNIQWDRDDA